MKNVFITLVLMIMSGFLFAQTMQLSPNGQKDVKPSSEITNSSNGSKVIIDTLHYDGANYDGIGTGSAGTYEAYIYFSAAQLATHNAAGNTIKSIDIFIKGVAQVASTTIRLRANQSSIAYSQAFTPIEGWNNVVLTTPFPIPASNLYIGYECVALAGGFPLGCDAGPVNTNANWIVYNSAWGHLTDLNAAMTYNWNIRARVDGAAAPSSDASLSALYVDGVLVSGFSPTVYSYNVQLPYGTTVIPQLTATTNSPVATKLITNTTILPGASTVVVTAQNTTTTQTYTVNFTLAAPSADASLSALNVDGVLIAGFSPTVYSYNVQLPYGTTVIPQLTATTTSPVATKLITNTTVLPGASTVVVTAQNTTTTQTYTVNFTLAAPSADASLSALNVDGVLIAGFSPSTYTYTIELPFGTTVIPQLTAATTSPVATKLITNTTVLPGASTVVVTAQNTTTTLTYTVNFTLAAPSADASLSALNVDGVLIAGFSSTTYSYTIELPFGTTVIPQLTATTTSPVATKLITNTTVLPGASTVVVTAQNTTTIQTYTVNFTLAAPSNDATLSALNVDGNLINGFSPSVYSYSIELPFGTTAVPVLTATTNDINATKVINNISALPGTSTVVVTAQDGNNTNTYSVEFTVAAAGADATLATMLYGGTAVPGFSSINFEYNIELPQGTTLVPALSGTTSDADAIMVIADAAALPGSSTITVTAQNTVNVNVYTVHFTVLTHVDGVLIAPISIYPIPAQNTITVDSEADLTVVLTDALGKVLVTKNITASDNQVDVSALPDGIYFLRTGNNSTLTKIIKLNR